MNHFQFNVIDYFHDNTNSPSVSLHGATFTLISQLFADPSPQIALANTITNLKNEINFIRLIFIISNLYQNALNLTNKPNNKQSYKYL